MISQINLINLPIDAVVEIGKKLPQSTLNALLSICRTAFTWANPLLQARVSCDFGSVYPLLTNTSALSARVWKEWGDVFERMERVAELNRLRHITPEKLWDWRAIHRSLCAVPFKLQTQFPGYFVGTAEEKNCFLSLKDGCMVSESEGHTLTVWNEKRIPLVVFRGHTEKVTCFLELANGQIASGSEDRSVRIWNRDGTLATVLQVNGKPQSLFELTDGGVVVTLYHMAVNNPRDGYFGIGFGIWNREGTPPIIVERKGGAIPYHYELPDGRIALYGAGPFISLSVVPDRTIQIWNRDGTLSIDHLPVWSDWTNVPFVLSDGGFALKKSDHSVTIWNPDGTHPTILQGDTRGIACFLELSDRRIAAGCHNGIQVWNRNGSVAAVFKRETGAVICLLELSDGWIAAGYQNGIVKVWNSNGTAAKVLQNETPSNNDRVAMGMGWDEQLTQVHRLIELPVGHIVARSMDQTIRMWKLDGTLVMTFDKPHGNYLAAGGLSHLSHGRFASCSNDRRVKIWKPRLRSLKTIKEALIAGLGGSEKVEKLLQSLQQPPSIPQ